MSSCSATPEYARNHDGSMILQGSCPGESMSRILASMCIPINNAHDTGKLGTHIAPNTVFQRVYGSDTIEARNSTRQINHYELIEMDS